MKALIKDKPTKGANFTDLTLPKIGENDLLVRVQAAAICGTDIHIYQWNAYAASRIKLPLLFGYEYAAEVVEVEKSVTNFKKGDRVAAETHVPWGHSYQCTTGLQYICYDMKILGFHMDGAFAEYAVLPAVCAWKLDPSISYEIGATMEPFGIGVHAMSKTKPAGKKVIVFGCGPIGIYAQMVAKLSGAEYVIGVDVTKERLDLTDTLAGAVDIGMISRTIKPEEESQGAYWVAVAKDAVFPIISSGNPYLEEVVAKGISQERFNGSFITGSIKTWGEVIGDPSITDEIHVYGLSDSAGAADQWALFSGGNVQGDLLGIGVNGEPAHVDTVRKDPLGNGFSNLNSAFDATTGTLVEGVMVPPIDINGNGAVDAGEFYTSKAEAVQVIADGTYPSPPARFENLATKGKPSGLVLVFIKWILTDGQQYLDAAGYVPLSPQQQAESLGKLN